MINYRYADPSRVGAYQHDIEAVPGKIPQVHVCAMSSPAEDFGLDASARCRDLGSMLAQATELTVQL